MDVNTFLSRYKTLSTSEQDILKILSIAYEPVNQNALTTLLKMCDIRRSNGTQITSPMVKEYRELLDEAEWLRLGVKNEIQVASKYLELVMRMAVIDDRYKKFVKAIQKEFPYREFFSYRPRSFEVCIREMRIALYEGNLPRFAEVMMEATQYFSDSFSKFNFFGRFFSPFDPEWLKTFPFNIQQISIGELIKRAIDDLEQAEEYVQFTLDNHWENKKETGEPFYSQLFLQRLLQGDFKTAFDLVEKEPLGFGKIARQGVLAFFKNDLKVTQTRFSEALKLFKKTIDGRFNCLPDFPSVVQLLAELKADNLKRVHAALSGSKSQETFKSLNYLRATALFQENKIQHALELLNDPPETALEWLFFGISGYWCERPATVVELEKMRQWHDKAQRRGYRWLEMEFANLIAKFEKNESQKAEYEKSAEKLRLELGVENNLTDLIQRTEKWERLLNALTKFQPQSRRKGNKKEKLTRLVWWLDLKHQQAQPVEQTYGKGGWSKGRNVALKRLKEGKVDNMTDQDKEAAKAIRAYNQGYYGTVEYHLDFEKILKALIGHPLLFLSENPSVSVELIAKKPQLLVEEKQEGYELKFNYDFKQAGTFLERETPTRYNVLTIQEEHLEINRLLDFGKLKVPAKGKDKLVEAIGVLSAAVTVQSEVGGEALDIQTIEGNPMPCLHLLPVGDGFKLEFFVKPFTNEPPYFKPGHGRENVIAEVSGKPTRAIRDLKKENTLARQVEDACPTLQKIPSENREWLFDDVEDCLSVLLELEPLRENGDLVLEHPKGEKLRIAGQVGFDNLAVGIRKERDWFEVSGKVRVREDLVLDFRQLLDLAQHTDSRFVEVSDGQFLALTNQLRRRLEELNNIFSKTKNDLRFHPLAASMLEDFTGLLNDVEVDAAWKKQIARMKEARDLHPKVPSTLKAELRNYQEEGFRWLSQLAHWGVGACLADDMGLGKTIQALAVLLDRAKQGSALVVAPASVVRNWFHETNRFAPTLRPLIFGQGDRREMLDNLQPFDLLLCSYGLMQQESDMLTDKTFATIVLDEAQAIKNRATKRSQTAMQLQGDFKIITTGTPVENHLGELWNLFGFLNPGLLGSLERFNERFAFPIEKNQDKERRTQLRRLLQPFILRRRKNDVLDELPEKTEVTLSVELSPEERAFYEALRRQALENIEAGDGDAGDKRFKILAELMRLRQACCHPRMVTPESELSSSKLGLFAETVEELLSEGHKALVFSQFVKHLKIVEEWVKGQGISYQYLDGSTPLPQRDKAIRAFQGGEGDLFLISLKAGGFGLNLTAADYVIHLDPWWNPAVEDQASDRAHRIGQQRPVTIYRLITEDTIEEKIVKLHADKRELADSLLEGAEVSGKLSAEELLELIRS
jgi:superfamily II DNA or RNA helicase